MRLLAATPVSASIPREIYILAGESDMSGRGVLSEAPTFPNSILVKNFANDWTWKPGAEPIDSPTGQVDSVSLDTIAAYSPGMAFASRLAALRPGYEVGLVPCAVGGSTVADWAQNASRSTLYGSMVARAKEAAKSGSLRGVVWILGKNDANDETAANAWDTSFAAVIAGMRADLSSPNLPVVVAAIGDPTGVSNVPYWSTIRSKQLAMTGTNLAVVDTIDLPRKEGDPIHLSTSGLTTLGQRYALAMSGLL